MSGRGEGVLSAATTTIQVVVGLDAGDVPGVLSAIGGRALVVVVRDGASGGPATVPTATPTATPTTAGPTG